MARRACQNYLLETKRWLVILMPQIVSREPCVRKLQCYFIFYCIYLNLNFILNYCNNNLNDTFFCLPSCLKMFIILFENKLRFQKLSSRFAFLNKFWPKKQCLVKFVQYGSAFLKIQTSVQKHKTRKKCLRFQMSTTSFPGGTFLNVPLVYSRLSFQVVLFESNIIELYKFHAIYSVCQGTAHQHSYQLDPGMN